MAYEDRDASDSDLSSVSEADSGPTRKRKLKWSKKNQHLQTLRRKAQKRLANARSRGGNVKHLEGLVNDISTRLGSVQTRGNDGKFAAS